MSEVFKNRKARILKALNAFATNAYETMTQYAKEFDIPPRIFQRRLKKTKSKARRQVTHLRLFVSQELALKKYIEFLDNIELSMRIPLIR